MSLFKNIAKRTLILAIILLACCTQPRLRADLPDFQSEPRHEQWDTLKVTTTHYRIHAQSIQATADDIAHLLEALYQTCTDLLGPGQAHEQLNVYTYADRRLYEEQLKAMGLSDRFSSGMFTPGGVPGIHLPLEETNGVHPFFTLAHEGVHQYLHATKGLPIANTGITLPAAPLWMSEGLALFMEAALVNVQELSPGRVHPPRLEHLQQVLKQKKGPDLEALFSKSYGEPLTNDDYSVSWGIIHHLYQNNEWHAFRDFWLQTIAMAAERFLAGTSLDDEGQYLELQTAWAEILGRRSLQVARDFIGGTQGLASWQKRWQNTILQLTSKQ